MADIQLLETIRTYVAAQFFYYQAIKAFALKILSHTEGTLLPHLKPRHHIQRLDFAPLTPLQSGRIFNRLVTNIENGPTSFVTSLPTTHENDNPWSSG